MFLLLFGVVVIVVVVVGLNKNKKQKTKIYIYILTTEQLGRAASKNILVVVGLLVCF